MAPRNWVSPPEGYALPEGYRWCYQKDHQGERLLPNTTDHFYLSRKGRACKECDKVRRRASMKATAPSPADPSAPPTPTPPPPLIPIQSQTPPLIPIPVLPPPQVCEESQKATEPSGPSPPLAPAVNIQQPSTSPSDPSESIHLKDALDAYNECSKAHERWRHPQLTAQNLDTLIMSLSQVIDSFYEKYNEMGSSFEEAATSSALKLFEGSRTALRQTASMLAEERRLGANISKALISSGRIDMRGQVISRPPSPHPTPPPNGYGGTACKSAA